MLYNATYIGSNQDMLEYGKQYVIRVDEGLSSVLVYKYIRKQRYLIGIASKSEFDNFEPAN